MTFEDIKAEVQEEFPSFEIKKKSESSFMRLLGKIMDLFTWGEGNFMSLVTAVGSTVYVPDSWEQVSDHGKMVTLRHERVHMRQKRKYSMPLFVFLYFFFPLPLGFAYFRMKFEQEAYRENLAALVEKLGAEKVLSDEKIRQNMIDVFTGPSYFWTWAFKSRVEKWYEDTVKELGDLG